MSLFKRFNKNKTASAASTPVQSPRASMQSSRSSSDIKLTHEQAIYKITHNKLTYTAAGRSNKNKSASAASTPAQTPRPSMQTIRDSGIKMTPEEALYKITQNMMTNASNGPFVR
ncbi:hypothetical protein EC991_008568 [Linnemannia zychae]|nr:hypothetical protein EC991_008568 [Linnemannia zychae]